ncbi:Lanthionine biosynthesis protein LanM [Myxococcus hansupus]|uniref:Lanthionine biosynthesis protein LanM n=2 Tax=Pseudomyxococcus hansupus TaxID=1297742 RepID=A0A0H4WR07_9BACT|nr:Lanthionine biosynthesis protein LanM [Myxococcus hansupus]
MTHAGMDEATLLSLLAEPAESLKSRCPTPPDWLSRLAEAYARSGAEPLKDAFGGTFAPIVSPLIRASVARVRQGAEALTRAHPQAPFDADGAIRFVTAHLGAQVDRLLDRTVVLEMHRARSQAPLEGATPQERFSRFVAGLSQPKRALELLCDYPVLARLVIQQLDFWEETSLEFLGRLAADFPAIREAFSPQQAPGRLVEVTSGLGDSHERGRTVRVLRFESGFRVVYKPRAMGIDARFGELLEWLNARGAPQLRAVRVIQRQHHGWAEFVAARPCTTRDEVARFYQRQGSFLALLYALNGNDIHRENLIAAGEHPVLVDLESLCGADYGHSTPDTYDSTAEYEIDNSVMRVMLLPFFHEGLERQFTDMSGIGGDASQTSVHPTATWKNWGTDEMHLVYQRHEMPAATNRPSINGDDINPLQFAQDLEEGFVGMYKLLLDSRQDLLTEGSPLLRMRGTEVRTILRASQFYAFILRDSAHPDLLRDALDRDAHQDRMWFGIQRSKFAEQSLRLIPHEVEELWHGDIPVFRNQFESRELVSSLGRAVPDFFSRSGFETVQARLGALGDEDLQHQLWFVRASLTALASGLEQQTQQYPMPRNVMDVTREQVLDAALRVGERLVRSARHGPHGVSWIGLAWTSTKGWWLRPLEYDLYSGLPGVALFLGYLGAVTDRPEFTELARGAMHTLRRQLERRPRMVQYLGGYDGWTGILYAWTHLATLWNDSELMRAAVGLLPAIGAMVTQDKELDLLRGSTGAIAPLLGLHRASGEPQALELARKAGDRLLETARDIGKGKAWLIAASPTRALTGFSHGAAGMAWALAELHGATRDARYRDMALQAVAFENDHYVPARRNWIDLRPEHLPEPPQFMSTWCHGAVGIGLARLRMMRHIESPVLREDTQAALHTAVHDGLRLNHCLCHGDLSVLELLAAASRELDPERWRPTLQRTTNMVIASIQEQGFQGGVPLKVETPGLMDGLAGIGLGLLRLAAPDQVPSVLTLDPPVATASAGSGSTASVVP